MKFSKYQEEIFRLSDDTSVNIAILATAGSGKTTTLLEILRRAKKSRNGIFLSFSRSIVEELKTKVPAYIEAKTLHQVGFALIRQNLRTRVLVVPDKYFKNALQLCKEASGTKVVTKEQYKECRKVEAVCLYARMTLTPFDKISLTKMATYFNIEVDEAIIETSIKLLKKALIGRGSAMWIDYQDMVYIPAVSPHFFTDKFDDIYLDEAQDTNNAQRKMIELLLKPSGRLISVGDDYQCIYGFSGADIESFKKIRERPNTVTLPLSVSYRCPKSGVQKAKEVCDMIESWEGAIEGEERKGTWDEIKEGDMVLSRITKPLIALYFKLLEARVKSNIVGKDIEQGLIDFAESCSTKSKEAFVQGMNNKLEQFVKKQQELGIKHPELTPQYAALDEKYQALFIILNNVESARDVIPTIEKIFAEDKRSAKLMTIHRSKGLENDRVFVIEKMKEEQLMPYKRANQEWEKIQERNLMFVSRTRHKKDLIFIDL